MWGLIKRIACKMTICCKSNCSLEPEGKEKDDRPQAELYYDYYSQKEKKFSSTPPTTSSPTYK